MYNCGISQFVASTKTCLPIKGLILGLSLLFVLSGTLTHAAPASELNAFWDDREPDSKLRVDHSPWQTFLNKFLDDEHPSGVNRLDYWSVNNTEVRGLAQYIEYLQSLDPRQLADQEQKAFWINLYNASTVYLVLQQDDDLRTIRKIRSGFLTAGPWQREILTIVRQDLSLDDIEHTILRPIWKDNRIHYVVNCASLGCPNLPKQVFTGENTEQMLETAAREFINHPRGVQEVNGRLQLSEIYKWYIDDFGGNFLSLKQHLNKYASPETAALIAPYTRAEYEYDWSLNKPN